MMRATHLADRSQVISLELPVVAVLVASSVLYTALPLPATLLGCEALAAGLLVQAGRRMFV